MNWFVWRTFSSKRLLNLLKSLSGKRSGNFTSWNIFIIFVSNLASDMSRIPFTVYVFWKKPLLINSRHIKATLLFIGVKVLLWKNLESGKFFFVLLMGTIFFLLRKAGKQCFRFVNRALTFWFSWCQNDDKPRYKYYWFLH